MNPTTKVIGYIYAIQSPYPRLLKIGFSKNPKARLAELQIGSPRKLRLVDQWNGTYEHEREIHRQIAAFRQHGEWFKIDVKEATKVIEAVTGNKSETDAQILEGSLSILHSAFDQALEAGLKAKLYQMPQTSILTLQLWETLKCHKCEAWTTQAKCPACGNQIM